MYGPSSGYAPRSPLSPSSRSSSRSLSLQRTYSDNPHIPELHVDAEDGDPVTSTAEGEVSEKQVAQSGEDSAFRATKFDTASGSRQPIVYLDNHTKSPVRNRLRRDRAVARKRSSSSSRSRSRWTDIVVRRSRSLSRSRSRRREPEPYEERIIIDRDTKASEADDIFTVAATGSRGRPAVVGKTGERPTGYSRRPGRRSEGQETDEMIRADPDADKLRSSRNEHRNLEKAGIDSRYENPRRVIYSRPPEPPDPYYRYGSGVMQRAYDPQRDFERSYLNEPQPGTEVFSEDFVSQYSWRKPNKRMALELRMKDVFSDFLSNEFDETDVIWDLVVLAGYPSSKKDSACGVWATTCGEYVKHTWPDAANDIKDLFDRLERTYNSGQKTLILPSSSDTSVSMTHQHDGKHLQMSMDFHGPALKLAKILDAISWLSTVLQTHITENCPIAYGTMIKRLYDEDRSYISGNEDLRLSIENENLERLRVPYWSSCWTHLFPRTPCAIDYAAKSRPSGMEGLEISFELMCKICSLTHEDVEDDGLVLYGSKALVYPVSRTQDCVQWHLVTWAGDEPSSLPLENVKRLYNEDLESLKAVGKHFLGLWSDPVVTLGTEMQSCGQIGWTKAKVIKREKIHSGYSVGASFMLPKLLSLKMDHNFVFAKSRIPQTMSGFDIELHAKINVPVLLYSPEEKRAWLVSYVSVLLQLARARAKNHSFLGIQIPPCEPSGNGGQAAYDLLLACYKRPLKQPAENQTLSDTDQGYTVEEYIRNIMISMDKVVRETSRAKGILRTFRERIVGFELADIANTSSNMEMKEHDLEILARGSWAPLLDEVEATFFYASLPDPIIPGEAMKFEGRCGESTWRRIPTGYNFLTASMPCLAHMARRRNPAESTMRLLTGGNYWHCQHKTYEYCRRDRPHTCYRLQELSSHDTAREPKIFMSDAAVTGAVVFRYSNIPESLFESGGRQLVLRQRTDSTKTSSSGKRDSDSGYGSFENTGQHRAAADPLPVRSLSELPEDDPGEGDSEKRPKNEQVRHRHRDQPGKDKPASRKQTRHRRDLSQESGPSGFLDFFGSRDRTKR